MSKGIQLKKKQKTKATNKTTHNSVPYKNLEKAKLLRAKIAFLFGQPLEDIIRTKCPWIYLCNYTAQI